MYECMNVCVCVGVCMYKQINEYRPIAAWSPWAHEPIETIPTPVACALASAGLKPAAANRDACAGDGKPAVCGEGVVRS